MARAANDEIEAIFRQFDRDGGGTIDVSELGAALTELEIECSVAEVEEMMRSIDKDGGGTIDLQEFTVLMHRMQGIADDDDASDDGAGEAAPPPPESNLDTIERAWELDSLPARREQLLLLKDRMREALSGGADAASGGTTPAGDESGGLGLDGSGHAHGHSTDAAVEAATRAVIVAVRGLGLLYPPPPLPAAPATPSPAAIAEAAAAADTPEAVALVRLLAFWADAAADRMARSMAFVEAGGEDDDGGSHAARLWTGPQGFGAANVDATMLGRDLDELAAFAFGAQKDPNAMFGSEAFRYRARDFPFFMFPLGTVCEQLDDCDELYRQYDAAIGRNEFLARPRCPDGKKCRLQDIPEHRLQFTHPCYAPQPGLGLPCPHSNRKMHMLCYHHNDGAATMNKEAALREMQKRLGYLDVSGFEIGDSGAHCLAYALQRDVTQPREQRRYKDLKCSGNCISPGGAIAILDAALDLVVLDISSNALGYKGSLLVGSGVGPALCQLLLRSDRLTHLNLSRNRLSDVEARFLCEGLKNNTVLKHLDVRKNEFGPQFGIEMAAALNDNRDLTELLVGWNRLEGTGSLSLLNELMTNSMLEVVDMSWTGINEEGAKCVARLISGSLTLRSLSIGHNSIGKVGCGLISKAIQQNKALQHLDLSFNPLGERATTDLVKDLRENTTLESLDLRCCKAGEETAKEINQTLKHREPKMQEQRILFSASIVGR